MHAIEDLLVTDTLLARSVRDVAWATAVAGTDGTTAPGIARPLRIAMVSRTLDGEAPHPHVALALRRAAAQIGSATCRDRVCQYVYISVVAVSLKTNHRTITQNSRYATQ